MKQYLTVISTIIIKFVVLHDINECMIEINLILTTYIILLYLLCSMMYCKQGVRIKKM